MRGGDLIDPSEPPFARMPFDEAIERQEEITRLPAPVPDFVPNGLRPLVVSVRLPPEQIPRGLAYFVVAYGDGPTQEESELNLAIEFTGWYAHDPDEIVEHRPFGGSPFENNEWTEVFEFDDGHVIGFMDERFGPGSALYVSWHREAIVLIQLTVVGTAVITHEDVFPEPKPPAIVAALRSQLLDSLIVH
jgi:hypothetical protein